MNPFQETSCEFFLTPSTSPRRTMAPEPGFLKVSLTTECPIWPPVGTIRRQLFCGFVDTLFDGVPRAAVSIYLFYCLDPRRGETHRPKCRTALPMASFFSFSSAPMIVHELTLSDAVLKTEMPYFSKWQSHERTPRRQRCGTCPIRQGWGGGR